MVFCFSKMLSNIIGSFIVNTSKSISSAAAAMAGTVVQFLE
ncbi:hypothetical protein O9A_01421 [Bartonella koehlerae C-29]|uniref:Uncharacterized protein n=1 Tax=Bartonella koehlerae C-29 TaxID=1134510 RepID=A0A067W5G2_9HYPH|nr:hypothetical protein O9A_01421 [Bartonella koehlerae C-29]